MTHSKLDETLDEILEVILPGDIRWINITPEDAVGEPVDRNQEVREATKQALLEAFEQSLPAEKTNNKGINEAWSAEDYAVEWRAGFNAYRNESIKVIRGNDDEE